MSLDPGSTDTALPPRTKADGTAGGTAGSPESDAASARSWLSRRRWPLAVGLVVVLTLLLVALLTPRTRAGDLDPESAQPQGSRAVAQILGRQGVDVRIARRAADVVRPGDGTGVTYLVIRPELVPLRAWDALDASGADLVLVEPDFVTLDALRIGAEPAGSVSATVRDPGCDQPDATAAGRTAAGERLFRLTTGDPNDRLCYRDAKDGASGSYAVLDEDGRTVTLIGQADVLRNGHLAEQGNAALALRTLGRQARLVWYVPSVLDLDAEQAPSLSDLLPDGLRWATLYMFVVVLVVMLWRGRRLGRLVSEPLPVVVRAAETQEGRARLYRQARARGRAAATLRTAALRRLAKRFDAAPDSDPALLASRVAAATGRPEADVQATLLGPAPGDDAALVRLANDLDAIEKDVAR